jgi:hypothetical protein
MWEHFLEHHTERDTITPEKQANMKLLFFMASTMTYNFMIDSMRVDPSLRVMAATTAAIQQNILEYFESQPQPQMPPTQH